MGNSTGFSGKILSSVKKQKLKKKKTLITLIGIAMDICIVTVLIGQDLSVRATCDKFSCKDLQLLLKKPFSQSLKQLNWFHVLPQHEMTSSDL